MLKSLRIKNYAIIDDLSIEFDKGFNVFTGETGAGKSIIVGALSFLLKGRSDSSIIKNGQDKAVIEGVFEIDNDNLKKQLDAQDIDYDGELIVKRVISKDNRNSIKINESSVTLNFLTDLLSDYVDIHSQKDSQYLFNKNNQLSLLDKYSKNENLLEEYRIAYKKYKDLNNEYESLLNGTFNEREIEFYRHDYEELEEAKLDLDEEAKLEEMETRLKSSEKYLNVLNSSLNIYEKDGGLKEEFYELINSLTLPDEKISNIKEDLSSLYYSLDDKMSELSDILNTFDDEELNIEKIEERLYTYAKLKRKHKTDVEGLLKVKEDLANKIALFDDRDKVLGNKKKEVDEAYKVSLDIANKLHESRIKASEKLEKDIKIETSDLMLNNCVFKINFNDSDLNSNGIDDVEFYVSMNKGEELKPLKNVASGGEVSRLMLALKSAFSKVSNTDLLILDEIDTGVSGKVGLAMGEKIAKIAKSHQVLCITHLASVAACGDSHYYIYKDDSNGLTNTHIRKLGYEEIINELASISSTSTSDNAINSAKELYENAQKAVNSL